MSIRRLSTSEFFLAHETTKKVKNAKKTDTGETIFYLKLQYSGVENQIAFIQSYRGEHFSEEILEELKAVSKYVKESENMSLKNNTLFG